MTAPVPPTAPSTGWRRRSRTPSVFLAGLVVGAAVMALALPGRNNSSGVGVAAGAAAGSTASAGAAGGTGAATGGDLAGGTAAAGVGGAGSASAGSGAVATGSAAGAAGGAGATATAGSTGSSGPLPNGGATFRGVTANKIVIGMANLDSSTMGAACPRCGNGAGADGAAADALVAAWHRDHLLPVNGRDFDVVNVKYNVLNSEDERSACLEMAQQVHPFLVGGVSMAGGLDQCLAEQNHLLTIDGQQSGDEAYLAQAAPYAWQIQPSEDRVWRNFAPWADRHNLLKGQVLGMYSPDDSVQGYAGVQEDLNRSFRAQLHRLGYKLAVDMTYGQAPDDALAVERFRSAGVTVAFIFGLLTEPSGFQTVAVQQGYYPKYPIAEVQNETTDAVADVTYNANAEDGNLAMKTQFFDWSARSPATPLNNAAASYCVNAYSAYTHRTLDVYNNDAELHYLLEICSVLSVARQAILNAGPDLTQSSFVAALEQIHGMQTAYEPVLSFSATKHDGGDEFADAQFNKNRWQPTNDYWKSITPWMPFYLP